MNVDTGSFRALEARAGAADVLASEVGRLGGSAEAFRLTAAAITGLYGEAYQHGAADAAGSGGARHARPRRERPGWLRGVVEGGQ